ncbi:MAG: Ig-like domain-containing protein [Verrucomicrobiota bacterium]
MQLSAFATGSVTLAWNACTDPCVAGYNVYYGGTSGTYTNEICAVNTTNVTVSGLAQGTTYYFAATTYSASGMESPFSGEVSYLVPSNGSTGNQPPTLSTIANLTINENAGLQTVNLSGITSGAANENQTLTVTAVSSNTGLIPNPTVNYTNSNTTGNLTFTPATNGNGTATITVTVNDGGTSNSNVTQTFTVTVNAVNQTPTLNAISNLIINENAGLQTVNLSGISSGAANENQTLTVTAVSSNTGLIPNPTVNYTNSNTTGNLTFTPATNGNGTATITVTVKDGGTSNNVVTQTFTVTVNAVNQTPTLNSISNLTINENAGLQTVNLSGISSGAANENQTLTVTAVSSNTGLIPNPTVNYTNSNTTGNLTFTPVANGNGTTTITVTVNDGGTSNSNVTQTFTVTVNAVNQAPTLNPVTNLVLDENAGPQIVNLSGISSGAANESQILTVTAASSDTNLVPNPMVNYTNSSSTGSLTFTPATNTTGTATITVNVNDNGASNNIIARTFTVTINATNQSPTLDPIPDVVVNLGVLSQSITLTGITPGTANTGRRLRVTAHSTNPRVVSRFVIQYAGLSTNGTLIFHPGYTTGTATVSVTVNNGARSNNIITRSFNVTILPQVASTGLVASTAVATKTADNPNGPGMTDPAKFATTLSPVAHVNGQFALNVAGASGHQYVIEASTDLVNWIPVQTNTAPFIFVDPDAGRFPQRFYRSVYAP